MEQISNFFNRIVNKMFDVQIMLEHCHRQTKSEPRHEALGEAYEEFSDLKDRIIEETIGGLDINYTDLTLSPVKQYTPAMSVEAAENLQKMGKIIDLFGQKTDQGNLSNLGQEVESIANKLKYKLSLTDSDEK